jgi:epoxyqueuosine reductase QueG
MYNTSTLQDEITTRAKALGADIVRFVDISSVDRDKNQGFSTAILIGIVLSKEYLEVISRDPEYFKQLKINNTNDSDEFHLAELATDGMADQLEAFIISNGFKAFSQSEENLLKSGFYNKELKSAVLPHKTIARLSGIGWIGKHDLIVTPEFGSAICMCTVLTDAPFACSNEILASRCGECNNCIKACKVDALKGNSWDPDFSIDQIIDVFSCIPCFQCVVHCPWTRKYMRK